MGNHIWRQIRLVGWVRENDRYVRMKESNVVHKYTSVDIQLAHQLMHIHKIVYFKTFKIAPTCFDPTIIFRELYCSLLKSHFKTKHSLINSLY